MEKMLTLSSSPHIHSPDSVTRIMFLVCASLAPAGIAGIYFFGLRALLVILTCCAAAAAAEYAWTRVAQKPSTLHDLSAVVTGLLLAYNLPPSIPLWAAAIGSVFAIVIVKQCFGGLGQNIVNPALAARAVMLASWPVAMTTWTLDGVTSATPLAILKGGEATGALPSFMDVFWGHIGGCIGETSAIALLAGGIFLIATQVISWHIPVAYIGTVAVLSAFFSRSSGLNPGVLYELCSGGLMLGAFFMATDYTTSPIMKSGQIAFGVGCGLIATLIRYFGGYPEGVSYSILIMNLAVPIIDRLTEPKIFGEVR